MGEAEADEPKHAQSGRGFSHWFKATLPGGWVSSWEREFSWHPGSRLDTACVLRTARRPL